MMTVRFWGQTRPHMLSSRLTESDPELPPTVHRGIGAACDREAASVVS
jgi:hypothetical protein